MTQEKRIKIIDVNSENVERTGFFCFMSKRKSEGFRKKLEWLKARFSEGMRIKMFQLPERGFIEYIPGQYAWRAVHAEDYMMIHCLWVVGKSKKKGLGGMLLEECIQDAKQAGMSGVAMVTSERVWLAGKKLLLKHGFESVDQAPPAFNLMIKKFKNAPSPSFTHKWEEKASGYGQGLTVICSPQCPYIPDAANTVVEFARKQGIQSQVFEIKSCQEVRDLVPSAYGVFSIVYNSRLLSYYYLLPKDLEKALKDLNK
jgi:N-acetylglutamate synthase-like GNAT family acetyltransferase